MDVNGMDFRSKSASSSILENMICTFTSPPDMDPDVDIGQAESGRYD
jgi:hypothetical protein